jgi:tetratricopeptide (TPR) repeat protein
MSYGQLFSTKLVADGRYEEALAETAREIAADPDDPEPRFNRGQALVGLERLEEAVASFEAALARDASDSALDPDVLDDELFDALRALAVSCRADRGRAVAWLERYEALLPSGRHRSDVPKWVAHLDGKDPVWSRDRA